MKRSLPSVRLSILVSPLGVLCESTWTDVPPVKAVTTAEETIQCWCTLGEQHKPPILIYSLSVVMIPTHLYKYLDTYLYAPHWNTTEEPSSPWMMKNDRGRHFFHMSHKILNDVALCHLSCVWTHKNTCTGLWPWLQEAGLQGLGREVAAEAQVSCADVCKVVCGCEICVSVHNNWGIFLMRVRTFLLWNILSKTPSVSNMRLIQAGWYYICLAAWEIDKASIKGIPVKGC